MADKDRKRHQSNREDCKKPSVGKRILGIAAICLVVAGMAVGLWKLSGEADKPSKQAAFRIGEETIYMDEVNFCMLQNITGLGITTDTLDTTQEDGTSTAQYYKQKLLELIMNYHVEAEIAKKQGITLTDEEQQNVRTDVVQYMGKVDGRVLRQYDISQERMEEIYTLRYLAQKLEDSVTADVEQVDQKYCTMYMLLFPKVETDADGNYQKDDETGLPVMRSDEEIEQAKQNAEEALQRLKDGEAIEELAKEYGVEAVSGEESNLADSFGEPFSEYANSLKKGEYSPVLETESCYAIAQMVEENNEKLADQILSYYQEDADKEAVAAKRTEWYEELGVGEEPDWIGASWKNLSFYDYLQ